MLKQERQAYILHEVSLHNQVLSANLSQQLNVSEDTVRRDLQELADTGKLIKVHGGALSLSYNEIPAHSQPVYAHAEKRLIARKAIALIRSEMFVMTTGGTTVIELARALPQDLKATFVSGSIPVILEYSHHPGIEVIVIGDKISKNAKITVGGEAITRIGQIRADLCFLGVNAIDPEGGITDNDWDVAQIKKAMIAASRRVICLSIAEKINTFQPIHVSPITDIDVLITELPPENPLLEPYRRRGIEVL